MSDEKNKFQKIFKKTDFTLAFFKGSPLKVSERGNTSNPPPGEKGGECYG